MPHDHVSTSNDISVVLGVPSEPRRTALVGALAPVATTVAAEATVDRALDAVIDLVPDVVVLDDRGDRVHTGEACLRSVLRTPATRALLLVEADDELAYESVLQGAFSVLMADAPETSVVDAVRAAARGESILVPGCARRLLADARRIAATTDPFAPTMRLTETEQEVLRRVSDGDTPSQIAADHDVTPRLVNLHTGYAVAKLHHHVQRVRTRAALS
jgi:DNA-binding NarL/FixJ family response regulator